MKYRTVAEAKNLPGLKLVLTMNMPGPWGIAARTLMQLRQVPFVAVGQTLMQPNEELVAWTGRRNAPVAVYDDEPAVDSWIDIMNLAERLGSGPSLFADDPVDRALAIGFSAEICAPGGFGWCRRVDMFGSTTSAGSPDNQLAGVLKGYGMTEDALAQAPARVAQVMRGLAMQLHRQRAAGSRYIVGDRLLACDVHWACFSILIGRLAPEDCLLPEGMGERFDALPDEVRDALDPILIEHRDHVWRDHIGLPLEF